MGTHLSCGYNLIVLTFMCPEPTVQPITPTIGAEIDGIDVRTLNKDQIDFVRQALNQYQLILFRNQKIDLDSMCEFSALFGELMALPYIAPIPTHPKVIRVLKEAEEIDMGVFGGEWHSDFSFLPQPPSISILYAHEVPSIGGDTLWANMVDAFRQLPGRLVDRISHRRAVHTGAPYGVKNAPDLEEQFKGSIKIERNNPDADRETLHPVVCTHPDTGENTLFINPTYTVRIEGCSESEGRELLDKLFQHCTRPETCCRIQWRQGTLALWDNRRTMHYAVNDYDGHRREMWRTTLKGHAPLPAAP